MSKASILMARRKSIALAAHDHRKEELVQWAYPSAEGRLAKAGRAAIVR
jgi:methylglyoxal synthase